MTIEADFKELMTQTITIEAFAGNNAHGEPSYSSTAVSHTARVVGKTKMVRTAEGKEVVSTSQAYIYGSPGITPKDRITLPDGTQPVILHVASYPDENGDHHQVVYT